MDKMNPLEKKPLFHLSTFIMNKTEGYEKNIIEENFDDDIQEYIYQIYHSSNRIQAINLRTNALEFIDQWRLKCLEQLEDHVKSAGQLILNAFDEYQNKRQRQQKCPHRLKQSPPTVSSITTVPITSQSITESSLLPTVDLPNNHHSSSKTNEKIEISIDRFQSSSANKKMSFNLIDFGRDFTFETLAHFSSSSSSSTDNAMTICENNYFIYSQNFNELIILSLNQSAHPIHTQLKKNTIIRDLSYVEWLNKCLIITDEEIYLFDYQTIQYDIIDSGVGYICGTIDNLNSIFYLIKQTTIYKYDRNCLIDYKVDQYPIVDSYQSQRLILDNKTNEYLALLVNTNDEKHAILIYSTKSLDNGYLYKIMIDDCIERKWLCSNGNHGWLIQGTYPGSCFDLNIHGLNSIRVFNCNQIQNMITMNEHQCFFIRTNTDIFMLKKNFFVNLNK